MYNVFMEKEEVILIVEDQFMSRKYLEDILRSMEYKNIYLAENAKDAIEITQKKHIDLVFMDINLEGSIDGIQCAFAINKTKQHPVIYISAYSDAQTISDAGDTNFYGYIFKPYTENDVSVAINVAKKHIFKTSTQKSTQTNRVQINSQCVYDMNQKQLYIKHRPIKLTRKEILLIELLLKQKNKLVKHDELKNHVWNKDVSDSTIRDTFWRLRKKAPVLEISNRFGIGYVLKQIEQ